jgi:hypothetical protein
MTRWVAEIYDTSYDFEATEWFWGQYKQTTNYEEFRDKYEQGSKGAQLFERFTSKFELAGVLIEYGFLDHNLYFDRYGDVQTEWEMTKSVIYGITKEWNYPSLERILNYLQLEEENGQKVMLLKLKNINYSH